jgi:hypothetical protein
MSAVAFIRGMMDAGFSADEALRAAEVFEATVSGMAPVEPAASKAALRTRRWRERQASPTVTERHETSQNVTASQNPSPSPSPPDPPYPAPIREEIYPTREAKPTNTEIARGFLAFWSAYPRKKSKDAAAKAFASAMKRIPDPDPLAVILAGLERAMPGWDEPTFIPYPASWLNAGGWDDEAPSPRTGTRHDRPANDARAEARSVWSDIIADSDGPRTGPPEPLRLAG